MAGAAGRRTGMKKWWLALGTVLALSIGIALADVGGKNGKTNAECKDGTTCCCCAKSCPK